MSQSVTISRQRLLLSAMLMACGVALVSSLVLIQSYLAPEFHFHTSIAIGLAWPAITVALLSRLRLVKIGGISIPDQELEIVEGNVENRNTFSINKDFKYLHFSSRHARDIQSFFRKKPRLYHSFFEFLPDNIGQDLRRSLEKAMDGMHITVRRKIGDSYFELTMNPMYDSSSEVSGVTCHFEDITQKIAIDQQLEEYHGNLEKAIEERTAELQEQHDFFQKIIDSITNLIFVRDDEGKYVLVNQSAADSFQGIEGGVIGKTALETHHSKQQAKIFMMEDVEIINTGNTIVSESIYTSPDGHQKQLYLTKDRIEVKGKKYVLGVHTDITELKKQENALIESNKELKETVQKLQQAQGILIESEKLASLGQLTAGLAHEINNPINYVSGNVKPLLEDFSDIDKILRKARDLHGELIQSQKGKELLELMDELEFEVLIGETRKLLEGIEDGTRRVKELMNSLKNLSRKNENSSIKFDLNKIINSTIALVKPSLPAEISIHADLNEIPGVWGSPGEISQVLLNMIDNSIFAMEGEGSLHLSTSLEDERILIRLQDSGKGISKEDMKKIFEPFYTTKEVGQGTGLGLAISHQIINKHKGQIQVESEVGRGTTFLISLPLED